LKFANRKQEFGILDRAYNDKGFQFVPVYGRRRVGKTRLVQEFIRNKPALYFMADRLPEADQLRGLGQAVGEHFDDFILKKDGFRSWQQFFEYLREKNPGRLIVAIDEFPYLVNSNPSISSVFQKGIDSCLANTGVFLILTGSSVGMMEKEMLLHKAPLYGRRTGSLEVGEMPFEVLREFFPKLVFDDLLRIWTVAGTMPSYLEQIDPAKDIFSNIRMRILEKGSFLHNEVEFLLREELREPRNYFAILRAVAQGRRRLSEIINDTGFDKSLISRYLEVLQELRLVCKDVPVTEHNPSKSKQGLYRLRDRFFAFWFRYVFPNRAKLDIGNADFVLSRIRADFEGYVASNYEDVCRETCGRLMKEERMRYTSIGRWWSRDAEMDVAAFDEEDGTAWYGECKWRRRRLSCGGGSRRNGFVT
jgi:AAA+ ATPase superfamily predicted ATPase